MKHTIEVNNIKLYCFHGCLEEEAKIGGHYSVDVQVRTDFTTAAEQDDLSKTVDYVAINALVKEEMMIRSKLIEAVGLRIVNRIKGLDMNIYAVRVKVIKHCPPINGDVQNVAIILEDGDWNGH